MPPSHNNHNTANHQPANESPNSTAWDSLSAQASSERSNTDPIARFDISSDRYPIFSQQGSEPLHQTFDIRETLSRFTGNTADLVAQIDGTGEDLNRPPADHVIYLDKSARPVSWLVNVFWDRFSDQPRPDHSYLAVDRKNWFNRAGVETSSGEYLINPDGTSDRLATFHDFLKLADDSYVKRPDGTIVKESDGNITRSQLARVRSAFLKDGLPSSPSIEDDETDFNRTATNDSYQEAEALSDADVEQIFNSPTILDGKNVLIVDEVKRSGSTLKIAEWLIKKAVPEVASVNGTYFWSVGSVGNEPESVPVWYDKNTAGGRGIGDVNRIAQIQRYLKYRDNPELADKANLDKLRAQLVSYPVRGTAVDLSVEPDQKSREVMREIKLMREDYDAGRILPASPHYYDFDKYSDHLAELGVEITPDRDAKNGLVRILETFESARQQH